MEQSEKTLIKKIAKVQEMLKVPKNHFNDFGKYNYRTCEDILEAVKKLLAKEGLVITISNEVINLGNRYYIKAIATVSDGTSSLPPVTAVAREPEFKKGMDESQLTGSASSYANKRALCNLFAIDDGVDADLLNVGDDTADYSYIYQQINSKNDLQSLTALFEEVTKIHPEYADKNHPVCQAFTRRRKEIQE